MRLVVSYDWGHGALYLDVRAGMWGRGVGRLKGCAIRHLCIGCWEGFLVTLGVDLCVAK